MVRVISGANNDELSLEGKTVADVRSAFSTLFNIADNAQATVNGSPVEASYVLQADDELTFTKATARKG